MPPPDRERGAALLTVLLLVAVIAVLAGTALERVRLATRTAGTAGAIGQARGYAVAAEALATVRVGAVLAASPERVGLAGGWIGRPFPLPVPDGRALATLSDGGNCFNLNGLVGRDPNGASYTTASDQVQAFGRLMRLVGVPAAAADPIAAAAADWIDTDATPNPAGAEDERYAGYRPGNTLMADPSELRAVAGVTPAIYATLRPWICTLPIAQPATLNVDTLAPEQAPLVAALSSGPLGVEAVRSALLARPAAGWASAGDFWAMPSLRSAGGATNGVGVRSQWFALRVDVAVGDAQLEEHALIDASALPPRLVSRQWGEAS